MMLRSLIYLWMLLYVPFARAWPPDVAPELEFTNRRMTLALSAQEDDGITANKVNLEYQEKFKERVQAKCPTCTIEELKDKYGVRQYRVHLKSLDWYFNIVVDPGIVEITSKPIPMNQMPIIGAQMQSLVWDVAKEMGLRHDTAGHLNFGIKSTFGNDALFFYNFLVDYLNHPALTEGLLGYTDTANAPHPEVLKKAQRKKLQNVFRKFNPEKHSIQDLAKMIVRDVYYRSTEWGTATDGEVPHKYQAVNVSSIAKDNDAWPRLELRAVPMQENAAVLNLFIKLFMGRMEHLKKYKQKMIYDPYEFHERTHLADQFRQLHNYVTEAGLDWGLYRTLIPERYEKSLKQFEKKIGYKNISGASLCFNKMRRLMSPK